MARLLYIKASPRGGLSDSLAVADAFVRAYRDAHPGHEIVELDVFRRELIPFDGLAITAKYTILHGASPSADEMTAWKHVEALIEEFLSADRYVMAVPMWNFSIPYRLKHYIDILVQPGYTFAVGDGGALRGLVSGKPVFIAYARGSEYPAGTDYAAFDLQTEYLETVLRFIGFTDIRSVTVEPTIAGGPEVERSRREEAITQAVQMARDF